MSALTHLSAEALQAGLDHIRRSPADRGRVELIVRRPAPNLREVLEEGELDVVDGLIGDSWKQRSSSRMPDRSPHPDMQINLMNASVIALLAQDRERWALAGDQFFVDLDLSVDESAAGTRLSLGTAVIEITDQPHTGCAKFVERFGLDAMKFVNSPLGRTLNLRGINARVVTAGRVHVGDIVTKMSREAVAS